MLNRALEETAPVTLTTLRERLDLPAALSRARCRRDAETDTVRFAQAALAAAKQEGLRLAVRARYVALAAIACLLRRLMSAGPILSHVGRTVAARSPGHLYRARLPPPGQWDKAASQRHGD
jgi:hypothetical protein